MGTLGPAELLVILLVALLVLGPERLPDAARKVGQFVGEVRKIGSGFQNELRDAMNVDTKPATGATAATPSTTPAGGPASEHGLVRHPFDPSPGAPPGTTDEVEVAPPPPARPDTTGDPLP